MTDYNHISHTHCWNNQPSPCGIPLDKHTQCCLCDLKPPTVEPTECDHSATVGGFCKCARKALNLTDPTETREVEKWEEKFDAEYTGMDNEQIWDGNRIKNFIRETLAIQKEELLKELEGIIRLMFIDSASTDEEVWRNKTIYEAITIIKNLKGGV